MMLAEIAEVQDVDLPLDDLQAHLRLGSGFPVDAGQDALLLSFLRAALNAVETRCGKAVLRRAFALEVTDWQSQTEHRLPLAPVTEITDLSVLDAAGDATMIALDRIVLLSDAHQPKLRAISGCLPAIPSHGRARLEVMAGYGDGWSQVPPSLRQAVLMLAAHFYEFRHDTKLAQGCMPFGVSSLLERYRVMRIGGGQ